ncbi:hypothetical protein [Nocardioides halotolerans]|uniref:hypothetical protein n=1 Tax=Nocardioides halotolerans TaxID=433660 RepID=UPI0003F5B8CD|nr:hypothetical protein [Nocardioides halotolerans]
MRFRALLLLALLALVGSLAGCSDDEPESDGGSGLPSHAQLTTYFEAITGADVDELAKVQTDIAAEGSPAQDYAAYLEESARAADDAGTPGEPVGVEAVDGGFKACAGPSEDSCATWSDLRGQDGRLADFTVNGTELDDLLVDLADQPAITSPGLYEVKPDWAYLQPRTGTLLVVCTITASDVPLSPKPGIYIAGDAIVDGAQGQGPATVDAGTSSPVVLAFPDARDVSLDGQVTFDLKIGDRATESIGFGLTTPAA